YLVYSHTHWDHTSGGQVFKNEGATILSHIDARDWLLDNPNPNVVVADEVWEGNFKEIILGGKTLELHHFGPSHGEGMTVFYLPEDKIVFLVDIVTPKRLGFTIMPDFSPKGWIQTLIEVEKLDFDTAMIGHKRAFGPSSEVTEVREYLQDLRAEIFRMVQEGVNPFMIPSTIELPKYQDWEFYDEWLEMNAWRVILEQHMGW
ncbi:MAG: MBL fold metallo-hydrolase, partial [Nitrosopumilus sp.]